MNPQRIDWPAPSDDALAASEALSRLIAAEIAARGGWIGFDRFMEMALYTPRLGYYSGGSRKFGAAGDFITAPEISPLFGRTLAVQAREVMALSAPHIIEVGAGTGRLAANLLRGLNELGALPETYAILDLSGELRERQRETIAQEVPALLDRVRWLDRLPAHFDGLVVANELLDALPVRLVEWQESGMQERGVSVHDTRFVWRDRPAEGRLLDAAQAIDQEFEPPYGYLSEISVAGADWTAAWADILGRGALLLIDYGFPRHEYYHPQRDTGTLMCHYRHHAHADPFYLPGLQDITAHVDFTAVIEAGHAAGLDLAGYATQGSFLVNCGITKSLEQIPVEDSRRYLPAAQAVRKLIAPHEMGELFKVMALSKGIDQPLCGFTQGDRSETL